MALAEMLDATIHSSKAVVAILGVEPLASIPYLESQNESDGLKRKQKTVVIVSLIAGLSVILAFHFIVMPLDVFWYKLLRVLNTL